MSGFCQTFCTFVLSVLQHCKTSVVIEIYLASVTSRRAGQKNKKVKNSVEFKEGGALLEFSAVW